jgi:hypothetical protein
VGILHSMTMATQAVFWEAMEALLAINLISPQLMVVVLIAAAAVAVVAVAAAGAAGAAVAVAAESLKLH